MSETRGGPLEPVPIPDPGTPPVEDSPENGPKVEASGCAMCPGAPAAAGADADQDLGPEVLAARGVERLAGVDLDQREAAVRTQASSMRPLIGSALVAAANRLAAARRVDLLAPVVVAGPDGRRGRLLSVLAAPDPDDESRNALELRTDLGIHQVEECGAVELRDILSAIRTVTTDHGTGALDAPVKVACAGYQVGDVVALKYDPREAVADVLVDLDIGPESFGELAERAADFVEAYEGDARATLPEAWRKILDPFRGLAQLLVLMYGEAARQKSGEP